MAEASYPAKELETGLLKFSQTDIALADIQDKLARHTLAQQMIASLRRI